MIDEFRQSPEFLLNRLLAANRVAAEARLRRKQKRAGEIGEPDGQIEQKEFLVEYYKGLILAKFYQAQPPFSPDATVAYVGKGEGEGSPLRVGSKFRIRYRVFINYTWFLVLDGAGKEKFPAAWFKQVPALELVS